MELNNLGTNLDEGQSKLAGSLLLKTKRGHQLG
jgi:hypothetical protein